MLSNLEASLGSAGFLFVMLLATMSLLAWWPAIAAVVLSDRPLAQRIPLFVAVAILPPVSLVVMGFSIRNASPRRHRARRNAGRRSVAAREIKEREPATLRARVPASEICHACV